MAYFNFHQIVYGAHFDGIGLEEATRLEDFGCLNISVDRHSRLDFEKNFIIQNDIL